MEKVIITEINCCQAKKKKGQQQDMVSLDDKQNGSKIPDFFAVSNTQWKRFTGKSIFFSRPFLRTVWNPGKNN